MKERPRSTRTLLIMKPGAPFENFEIVYTYNRTKTLFYNREPDMEVVDLDGHRYIIDKSYIAGLHEVTVVVETKPKLTAADMTVTPEYVKQLNQADPNVSIQ